jgi:Stigma-specific protein, Stig1
MTRRFARMLPIGLLPMASAWLACTDLDEFEVQGSGGATSSSSTSAGGASGSGGLDCDVFEAACSGTCVNLSSDPMHCGACGFVDDGNFQDRLMKAPMGGGEPITLVEMMHNPHFIHLDATTIYWLTWDIVDGEDRIMKLAK